MSEIETEFLFEARVALYPELDMGAGPEGHRVIYFVKDGSFDGPRLSGRVVPNSGADWVRVQPDGGSHLDVRFCLETTDGALIYAHWYGRFIAPPEHFDYAMDLAKPDDPAGADRYYFHASPEFETSHPRYAWLNNIVSVTKSRTGGGGVVHRVFAIK